MSAEKVEMAPSKHSNDREWVRYGRSGTVLNITNGCPKRASGQD